MSESEVTKNFNQTIRHLLVDQSRQLTEFISEHLQMPPQKVEELIDFGAVYVNRQRCLSSTLVAHGDYVRVHSFPRRFPVENIDWSRLVIYQDENYVVVNKPAFVPVPPTLDNYRENLVWQLSQFFKKNLIMTHRLDQDTQGLVVLAQHKSAAAEFHQLLRERLVHKSYIALTTQSLQSGSYRHYMQPSARAPKVLSEAKQLGWQTCDLEVIDSLAYGNYFQTQLRLITGRTHQIRAQLAFLGAAIVNDSLYGANLDKGHLQLCCHQLHFKNLRFSCQPEFNV